MNDRYLTNGFLTGKLVFCIEPIQFSEKPVHKDSNHRRPSVNMKAVGNLYTINVHMQTAVASN